jgi:hypothetical protein
VTFTQQGACTESQEPRPLDECFGRAGGTDLIYTDFDLGQTEVLYWGIEDETAVGLAMDCAIDEPGETMVLSEAQSDLENGMARWIGLAEVTYLDGSVWTTERLDTRFTLELTDLLGPVPLTDGSALGLEGTVVAVVNGDFEANLLMEARWSAFWYPVLELFDELRTRPEHEFCVISTIDHAFFYEDVAIGGLQAVSDSPTMLGTLTTLTATLDAGTNVTYAWEFGDGQTGSGAVVSHQYAAPGTYTATVTASNEAGAVSASTEVTVLARILLPLVLNQQ